MFFTTFFFCRLVAPKCLAQAAKRRSNVPRRGWNFNASQNRRVTVAHVMVFPTEKWKWNHHDLHGMIKGCFRMVQYLLMSSYVCSTTLVRRFLFFGWTMIDTANSQETWEPTIQVKTWAESLYIAWFVQVPAWNFWRKNKMKPTNLNADTYVEGERQYTLT